MGDVLHRKKGDFEFASTDVGPRYHIAAGRRRVKAY